MPKISIKLFGWKRARKGIIFLEKELARGDKRMRRKLLLKLARALRDQTRRNITQQGPGWPKLSKWTRARTGRRKALITLRNKVKLKRPNASATEAGVIFESPENYTLTQHHDGFTTPAVSGKLMKFPLKQPRLLGLPAKQAAIFLKKKGPSVVPARPMWPDGRPLKRITRPIVRAWTKELDQKLRRKTNARL